MNSNVGRKILSFAILLFTQVAWAEDVDQVFTLEQLRLCEQEGYTLPEILRSIENRANSDVNDVDGVEDADAQQLCPKGGSMGSGG